MKKLIFLLLITIGFNWGMSAQTPKKIYNETIDPVVQIDDAVTKAAKENKFVVAQLGGNWCKWCIRFAKFIDSDPEIKNLVDSNFVYIHVNYNPRNPSAEKDQPATKEMLGKLGNPVRFGYPVLVVLDESGKVIHIQDSSFLESGEGYDKEKVTRFFSNWTPEVVKASMSNN